MYNIHKQSTGRARLTKTKGFILASLFVGVMALPLSVFAQISFDNSLGTITDGSPTSWALNVQFPIVNNTLTNGFYSDQNATVLSPPPGFLPFNIYVSSTTNALYVSFDQNGNSGFYGHFEVTTLSVAPTALDYFGNFDTIPGFAYPASVTATLTQSKKAVIVEVAFSNDPFLSASKLIETVDSKKAAQDLDKALKKIKLGKPGACDDVASFIAEVNNQFSLGNITSTESGQLLTLANAIKSLIPGCPIAADFIVLYNPLIAPGGVVTVFFSIKSLPSDLASFDIERSGSSTGAFSFIGNVPYTGDFDYFVDDRSPILTSGGAVAPNNYYRIVAKTATGSVIGYSEVKVALPP